MQEPQKAGRQASGQEYLDCLIPEQEAAGFLGYTVRALQNWRTRGGGPLYVRVSARSIRYRRRDLIAWSEARLEEHTPVATAPTLEAPPPEPQQPQHDAEPKAQAPEGPKETASEAQAPEKPNIFGRYGLIR